MSAAITLLRRSSRNVWIVLVTAVFAAVLVLSTQQSDSSASPLSTAGPVDMGSLTIDEMVYSFRPETCFIGDDSFVGSGTGAVDGTPYRVAASPSVVEITFGVTEEGASVPDGARWLRTTDVIAWQRSGTEVEARVELFERAATDESALDGTIWLSCNDSVWSD